MVLLLSSDLVFAQSRVHGYFCRDGTYGQPHSRTVPDGNPYNNYSFPGNYNPNTGRMTGGDPERYLQRYYGSQSLQPYGRGTPQSQPRGTTCSRLRDGGSRFWLLQHLSLADVVGGASRYGFCVPFLAPFASPAIPRRPIPRLLCGLSAGEGDAVLRRHLVVIRS
jgi:hypothetical protein